MVQPDLVALIALAAAQPRGPRAGAGLVARSRCSSGGPLAHRRTAQHAGRRRRNIAAHYDLGNDFYRLFLDETMTYSSAVFETADQSLADAQRTKYRRIAERAGLRAGMHVLEIGSGWGGFALYAAGELGCRVTSITISQAQHALATRAGPRRRARGPRRHPAARLPRHRGHATTRSSRSRCSRRSAPSTSRPSSRPATGRSRPGGRLSLQVITFPDAAYEAQRRGANWIQTYIFPGGLCPSLAAIERR